MKQIVVTPTSDLKIKIHFQKIVSEKETVVTLTYGLKTFLNSFSFFPKRKYERKSSGT